MQTIENRREMPILSFHSPSWWDHLIPITCLFGQFYPKRPAIFFSLSKGWQSLEWTLLACRPDKPLRVPALALNSFSDTEEIASPPHFSVSQSRVGTAVISLKICQFNVPNMPLKSGFQVNQLLILPELLKLDVEARIHPAHLGYWL